VSHFIFGVVFIEAAKAHVYIIAMIRNGRIHCGETIFFWVLSFVSAGDPVVSLEAAPYVRHFRYQTSSRVIRFVLIVPEFESTDSLISKIGGLIQPDYNNTLTPLHCLVMHRGLMQFHDTR